MKAEAVAAGVPADTAAEFFAGASQDPKVLKADWLRHMEADIVFI